MSNEPGDPNFFITTQWLDESVTKLVVEKGGVSPETACKIAADVVTLLVGADKRVEQYYPGLAEKVRRAYHLTIDAIRTAADSKGYAIGVHGSMARDIDLIACPWREGASSAEEVAEAIRAAAEKANPLGVAFVAGHDPCPRAKPHGRLCWSFHLGGGPYIDLSVMPRLSVEGTPPGPVPA